LSDGDKANVAGKIVVRSDHMAKSATPYMWTLLQAPKSFRMPTLTTQTSIEASTNTHELFPISGQHSETKESLKGHKKSSLNHGETVPKTSTIITFPKGLYSVGKKLTPFNPRLIKC
jgi:hypothetical protein